METVVSYIEVVVVQVETSLLQIPLQAVGNVFPDSASDKGPE